MASHIYIDGVKIIQNTGVSPTNTLNFLDSKLTTGKSFLKNLGDLSQKLTFKSILKNDQISTYEPLYFKLVEKTKKTNVPIIIDNLSFNGVIIEFESSFPVEDYKEYFWTIKEFEDFKPETKTFQTFNYKAATVTSKNTNKKTNAPSYITKLLSCNVGHNCGKKGVQCVYYIQKLLQSDGYYRNYKYDGLWCTYTTQEFKKWQKNKAKVKVTGKLDTATKNYLKKRFNIVSKPNTSTTLSVYSPSAPNILKK